MRIPGLHPSESALQRFADGESGETEHRRVAAHLARCDGCRLNVGAARDIATRARTIPFPDASPELLKRILASRVSGERVILQHDDASPRSLWTDYRLVAGLALVIGAVGYFTWVNRASVARSRSIGVAQVATDTAELPVSTSGLFLSRLLLPPTAAASQLPQFPRLSGLDGRRIKPGEYFFSRREVPRPNTVARETGTGSVQITASSDNGIPSWHIRHQWSIVPGSDGVKLETESVSVSQRDLRLISRTVHVSPYLKYSRLNISQRFNGNDVYGTMSAEQNNRVAVTRPISRWLDPRTAPYMSEGLAPVLLSGVNLNPRWEASLSFVGWAVVSTDVRYPIQLHVTGQERITVPAGTFDCWRLEVTEGTVTHTYWVRKSDGLGIRTVIDPSRSSGKSGNHEVVLTREVK